MVLSREDELAVEGDTLRAALATTIQEEVSMQMLPIKMKTENMLATLDTVLESIKYVFNKETQKTLANTFLRIQTTIENIEHSSFTLDTVISDQKGAIERILYNINAITLNLKENNADITRAIGNFADLSDSLARIDIKTTIEKADKALADFQAITDRINR